MPPLIQRDNFEVAPTGFENMQLSNVYLKRINSAPRNVGVCKKLLTLLRIAQKIKISVYVFCIGITKYITILEELFIYNLR